VCGNIAVGSGIGLVSCLDLRLMWTFVHFGWVQAMFSVSIGHEERYDYYFLIYLCCEFLQHVYQLQINI
jgi:hypothetical protein